MNTFTSTVAAAEIFLSINGLSAPTVIKPIMPDPALNNPIKKVSSIAPILVNSQASVASVNSDISRFVEATRQTTESEKIIGELRQWQFLNEDWDGEDASAPIAQSIKNAVDFVGLIRDSADLPQPMLHATGNVSLYWNDKGLYVDIEFLSDGRLAYFIKTVNENRHKGVLSFDAERMPDVFSTLIGI